MTSYLVLKIDLFIDLDTEVGTHALLCNTLLSNKPCPEKVKILAVKGLREENFAKFKKIIELQNQIPAKLNSIRN